jgi:hypothetical protein
MQVHAIACSCEICHRVFFLWPSQIRNGEGRFCSRACKHTRQSPVDRFWGKVDDGGGPDACWPWLGGFFAGKRYGQFMWAPGDNRRAHRVAWELTHGAIPAGWVIAHTCDNPPCCNPAHLWLATVAQNNQDRDRKGRASQGDAHWLRRNPERAAACGFGGRPGEANNAARLTEDAVRAIRRAHADGEMGVSIAKRFSVSPTTVCNIVKKTRWKHVL